MFKIFSAKKLRKKFAFLTQNKAKLCEILIITLVFEKNAIFRRKLSKIAENCDHNIDPQLGFLLRAWKYLQYVGSCRYSYFTVKLGTYKDILFFAGHLCMPPG
jgi:hypothetical protein